MLIVYTIIYKYANTNICRYNITTNYECKQMQIHIYINTIKYKRI